ncbi:hypothetical protein SAMN04487905_102330 [Actinopolyspora xinjiangensis]|uniref:Secreted protein n=1 Tax=Actinopolyspora xinjiangensis TaxID=405564 RepID=A0A1H0QP18_9ACTN|nr:hypothetical protein [Actinopolyspora xinjiangensis]SDP19123.1 hypothetical protein SAMN04487905_102330 [Actinopolyspora xinjiangensis]
MRFRRTRTAAAGIGAAALAAAVSGAMLPATATAEPARQQPPGCGTGCERVFDLSLPYDVRFTGWRDDSVPGGRSVLAYYIGDELHDSTELSDRGVLDAGCGWEGDAQRCAVTYYTGAHSSGALSVLLTADRGIERTDDVVGAAPGATLRRLDGNGRPDVAIRQSTFDPNYADAPQYWETYLEFEGEFVRTGCGAPEQHPSPAPTEPLYGTCVYY